eukprot:77480_1
MSNSKPNMNRKAALTVLDLNESATKQEIESKFRKLCGKHHPDKNNGDRTNEYDKIQQAKDALIPIQPRDFEEEPNKIALISDSNAAIIKQNDTLAIANESKNQPEEKKEEKKEEKLSATKEKKTEATNEQTFPKLSS